jgi:hypothetical protein
MAQFGKEQPALLFRFSTIGNVQKSGHGSARIPVCVVEGRGVAEEITRRAVIEADFLLEIAYLFAARGALDGQFSGGQDATIDEHLEVSGALFFGS